MESTNYPFSEMVDLPSGLRLQTHMLLPSPIVNDPALPKKLAICSHPWSRLGGCMDDPVLQSLAHPLKSLGYHVLLFNSRGVQGSSGWSSFTGFQEAEDLGELVKYATEKLGNVQDLVLVGYSNGCLSTSLQPPMDPPVRTSHIFLSYPLGPRPLLTLFNGRTYQRRLEDLIRHPHSRVLLVYGDNDEFTGASSYDAWASGLKAVAGRNPANGDRKSGGQNDEIAEAGSGLCVTQCISRASHFWRGGTHKPLVLAIQSFLGVH